MGWGAGLRAAPYTELLVGAQVFQKRYMEPQHVGATVVVVNEGALAEERRASRRQASAFLHMYSPAEEAPLQGSGSAAARYRLMGCA